MKKRLAKKIYGTRRGRRDSPRIAFAGAGGYYGNGERIEPWPWNRQTWEKACKVWWRAFHGVNWGRRWP